MSIQRLNWFERNVEKLVVAVAGASLLGVVAYQLSRPPTEVEVMRKQVPMAKVAEVLKQHADEISAQAADAQADRELRALSVQTDMAAAFAARLSGLRPRALAGTWPTNPVPGGRSTPQIGETVRLTVPVLAVLSKPVVRSFWSTIHPSELAAAPELAQLVAAKEPPFDHPGVSVELSLNGQRLRELLRGANIQPFWYEPTTAIVAVQIEREEQQPDGTWSAATVLPPMPGRVTLLDRLRQNEFDDRTLAETAFSLASEIQRPAWYRQAVLQGAPVGMPYVSPMDAERVGDAQARIRTLRQEIDQLDARLRVLEAELNRLRQPGGGPPQPGRGPGGPGGGGGGIGGGGGGGGIGGGGGGGAGRPPAGGPQQGRIQELERRIEEFRKQRQDKLDEIERLRAPAPSAPTTPAPPTGMQDRGVSPILLSSDVRLLAHDPSARPGRTYRYRAVVKLTNPVFARGNFIAEQQAALTEQLTISTAPSDWSAAVRVDDRTYFFVTSATGPNPLASGGLIQHHSATAEVFTFTWGHWRSGRVNITPGDVIAAKVTIPDVKRIEGEGGQGDTAPPHDPGQPPPGGPGGREGPSPGGPGAGGGGMVGPGGGGLVPGGAPGGAGRPGGGQPPAPQAPAPVLPSTDMVVSTDAFLLDVVPVAQGTIGMGGAARTLFIAVVRDEVGRILHLPPVTQRLPDNEPGQMEHNERMADYQRLQRAAEEGASQLRAGAGSPAGSGS